MNPVEQHRIGRYGGVALAFLSGGQVEHQFMDSVLATMLYDRDAGQQIIRGTLSAISSPRIAEVRCQLVEGFLADKTLQTPDGTPPEWLWMVDTDMVWEPDALYRLLAHADPIERPIIGGLCLAGRPEKNYPTVYNLYRDEHGIGMEPVADFPIGEVLKVGGTGAAFMLVHRKVLNAMGNKLARRPDGTPNPYPWFFEGVDRAGRPFGEDVGFCLNAQACGIPIHVDSGCFVGHIKPTIMDPRDWIKEHRE